MTSRDCVRAVILVITCFILSACGTQSGRSSKDSAPGTARSSIPTDPIPRQEARSRYGNGPLYQVYGETYRVLNSSFGYKEEGVASWYGKKFHGRKTSNQETYDMYAMTAAHKTLPLPTYVRVRNLRNNRSIVVRVNDRGPFVDNRLIDLSYSAAVKLDLVRDGTGLVEVAAISFDEAPQQAGQVTQPRRSNTPVTEPSNDVFVQVGAFSDAQNARRRFTLLRDSGISHAFVHKDTDSAPTLYRVRIGPIADVAQFDSLVAQLRSLGIYESHLVSD